MLKEPIAIQIYFNTDESQKKINLGLDVNDLEYTLKTMYFYNIDAFYKYKSKSDKLEGVLIFSAGEEFITPMTISEFKEAMKEHINKYEVEHQ